MAFSKEQKTAVIQATLEMISTKQLSKERAKSLIDAFGREIIAALLIIDHDQKINERDALVVCRAFGFEFGESRIFLALLAMLGFVSRSEDLIYSITPNGSAAMMEYRAGLSNEALSIVVKLLEAGRKSTPKASEQ